MAIVALKWVLMTVLSLMGTRGEVNNATLLGVVYRRHTWPDLLSSDLLGP